MGPAVRGIIDNWPVYLFFGLIACIPASFLYTYYQMRTQERLFTLSEREWDCTGSREEQYMSCVPKLGCRWHTRTVCYQWTKK